VLELTIRVPSGETERTLDDLLPKLPAGVHIRPHGEVTELLLLAGPGTPDGAELRRLLGPRLLDLTEAEAPDDWRERRLRRYAPTVIADRFLLRPEWAPPGEDPDLIEIVLAPSAAFGTGMHPTTQACLAVLAELDPANSFADLGCGSGILSIAAAHLGLSPVIAVDVDPTSLAAARANAGLNGVEIDARLIDLTADPAPAAEVVAANVPPPIHLAVAERATRAPSRLIASGFGPDDVDAVAAAWGARGLEVADKVLANEWVVLVMR
jgi:ribosomal protein L11 methyltransferase